MFHIVDPHQTQDMTVELCSVAFPVSRQNSKAVSGLLNRHDRFLVSLESPSLTQLFIAKNGCWEKILCPQHDVKLSTSTCFGKVGPRQPMEIEASRAKFALEFILQADTFTS